MAQPLDIVIVERLGMLKALSVKDFKVDELYKKCGFKKEEDFVKHTEWAVKCEGKKYFIHLYGKTTGRANSENKYDFPPPVDNTLFYGSCALVASVKQDYNKHEYTHLSVALWNKIYEKLFGGFEDLAATAKEDEEEEDELANVPNEKKTKDGYLKDGFVVDSGDSECSDEHGVSDDTSSDDDVDPTTTGSEDESDDIALEDIGSELSEESYLEDDRSSKEDV
ncbi:MAG: hypothetical protein ACOVRN_07340 [Flavobacterium sp.]